MTAVSQKLPNFIGGISQQPDELIANGTVKDAVNVIPDVRGVVSKRPGSELVKTLTNEPEGVWYDYYRDDNEQYILRIRRNGVVDAWDQFGVPLVVTYSEVPYNPTEGIQGKPPGLPTPEEPDPDPQPQYPNCSPADLTTTRDLVQDAVDKLTDTKEEIERERVNLSRYQNEAEGELYFEKDGKFRPKVGGSDINGSKSGPSNNPTYPAQGKPNLSGYNIDLVFVEKGDISYKRNVTDKGQITYTERGFYYGWLAVRKGVNGDIEDTEDRIAALEAQIPGLLSDYDNALANYENEARKCGIYENPFSRTLSTLDTPNPVPYFAHVEDADLQFVTINDYTFITNRTKIPRMNATSNIYQKNIESFVSLDVLQSQKPYSLHIDLLDTDEGSTFTRATQLEVTPGSWSHSDGECPFTDTEVFVITDDDKGELQFRLTTIGSQFYDSGSKPEKPDYDCRYQTSVELISSGTGWGVGDSVEVEMSGKSYTVTVNRIITVQSSSEIIIDSPVIAESEPLDSDSLLQKIKTAIINAAPGFVVDIIGNGLYVTNPENVPFKITTPDRQYLTCLNDTVNNVSLLPDTCKDGFLVKVVNSFIEEDDYWVVFRGEESEVDGAGYWEETNDPEVPIAFDWENMPYQIRRMPNKTFEIRPIEWGQRRVGDEVTNPQPSFIGNPINKLLFFKNRMTFLSGETVVMSRPNEYFNFWAFTAKSISPADPIDIRVSSTFPSTLYDGLDTAAGLLVMSENQQHLVVTDNTDLFTPETVSVKSIGTYQFNIKTKPVDMGQTVGFLNDAGYRSRFFELIPSRDYRYQATEVSKPVDQLIPDSINLVTSSKDSSMIAFAVKGTSDVWIYRFFQLGDERKQSAWFRWTLDGKVLHHYVHKNSYYAVTQKDTGDVTNPTIVTLQKFNLNIDRGEALINVTESMRDYDYQIHLDSYFMVTPSEMQYDSDTKTTSFRLPVGYHGDSVPIAYAINLDKDSNTKYVSQGRTAGFVSLQGVPNGVIATLDGNWKDNNLVAGFPFEMKIQLPTMYPSASDKTGGVTTKDTRSYLNLHRVQLDFESIGFSSVIVERKGREDYVINYESTLEDGYNADTAAIELNSNRVIPIYNRNINTEIYVYSTHPSPMTLISAVWEGDYNQRNYQNA